MKVRVKSPFYDDNGIHMIGEIAEVNSVDPNLMEVVIEEPKAVKKAKKIKSEV